MDDLKALCEEPIADEGFKRRTLAALPARDPHPYLRVALLTGVSIVTSGTIAFFDGTATVTGVASASALMILTFCGMVVFRESE